MRIAIDTGGTFTDCVYAKDGRLHVLKIASTPSDPGAAVLRAVAQIAGGEPSQVRHGTTVGTNALLERKGARVAFVTTSGFEDTIAIGRQARPKLYDLFFEKQPPLAPEELRFGVAERVGADGQALCVPGDEELEQLRSRCCFRLRIRRMSSESPRRCANWACRCRYRMRSCRNFASMNAGRP